MSYGVTVAEISMIRNSISLLLSCFVLLVYKNSPLGSVERDQIKPLTIRCIAGTVAFVMASKAVHLVPLTVF